MAVHQMGMDTLKPCGKAQIERTGDGLALWTTYAITPESFNLKGGHYKRHSAVLPGRYRLPLGEFTDISVTYNPGEMQILIGGEERYYTRRPTYKRAKNLAELNGEGFDIGLAVSKGSRLTIRTLTVTEYDDAAPVERGTFDEVAVRENSAGQVRPSFDGVIAGLSVECREPRHYAPQSRRYGEDADGDCRN